MRIKHFIPVMLAVVSVASYLTITWAEVDKSPVGWENDPNTSKEVNMESERLTSNTTEVAVDSGFVLLTRGDDPRPDVPGLLTNDVCKQVYSTMKDLHPGLQAQYGETLAAHIVRACQQQVEVEYQAVLMKWDPEDLTFEPEGTVTRTRMVWVLSPDPILVAVLMHAESTYNPEAKGPSPWDCRGLMQVHYDSHRKRYGLTSPEDLYQEHLNIRIGVDILRRYIAKNGGSIRRGLTRYGTNVRKVIANYEKYEELYGGQE